MKLTEILEMAEGANHYEFLTGEMETKLREIQQLLPEIKEHLMMWRRTGWEGCRGAGDLLIKIEVWEDD